MQVQNINSGKKKQSPPPQTIRYTLTLRVSKNNTLFGDQQPDENDVTSKNAEGKTLKFLFSLFPRMQLINTQRSNYISYDTGRFGNQPELASILGNVEKHGHLGLFP